MVDLNQQDIKIAYNFINKFLKQFEKFSRGEELWDEIYSVGELKVVRDKLRLALEDA